MTGTPDTIRVFIPLTLRRRNGRPRILPPADMEAAEPRTQDPHVLRAIACAWGWRRKIEAGEVVTIHDIAVAEKVSERFVNRSINPHIVPRTPNLLTCFGRFNCRFAGR